MLQSHRAARATASVRDEILYTPPVSAAILPGASDGGPRTKARSAEGLERPTVEA